MFAGRSTNMETAFDSSLVVALTLGVPAHTHDNYLGSSKPHSSCGC